MRRVFHPGLFLLVSAFLAFFAMTPRQVSAQSAPASVKGPTEITIGFIPGTDPKSMQEGAGEFAKLLQARIGIPVRVFVSDNYAGLVEAMKQKKVDFAFLSAMTFVEAEKTAGAKVLLKKVWHAPFYYSVILAKKGMTSMKQLKGKRFAFVDENSASGYLYPQVHFKKTGIDPKAYFGEVIFSGHHDRSVQMLNEGKVDAIAVFSNDKDAKDSAFKVFGGKGKPQLLWASAPIPNDPFCVRQDFYDQNPRISHDLMFAMIDLLDDKQDSGRFKQALGVSSLMLATSQQYEPVREMVQALGIKQ
jgi:phosphonate transport system substrate-binding protein